MKKFVGIIIVMVIMLVGTVAAFANDPWAEPGTGDDGFTSNSVISIKV